MLLKPKNIEHLTRRHNSALQNKTKLKKKKKNKTKNRTISQPKWHFLGAANRYSNLQHGWKWLKIITFMSIFFFVFFCENYKTRKTNRGTTAAQNKLDVTMIFTHSLSPKNAAFFPKSPESRQAALLLYIALESDINMPGRAGIPRAIRLSNLKRCRNLRGEIKFNIGRFG